MVKLIHVAAILFKNEERLLRIIRLLCEHGADVNAVFNYNCWPSNNLVHVGPITPLVSACKDGQNNVSEYLMDMGADVNYVYKGYTPFLYAVGENMKCVDKMLQYGNVDIYNGATICSPLHMAADGGNIELVERMINMGLDVNSYAEKFDNGYPLLIAANQRHLEIVELLLNRGANVNQRCKSNWTALFHAARRGHIKMVRLLIERGADSCIRSETHGSPLSAACELHDFEMVKFLVESGADTNYVCRSLWNYEPLYVTLGAGNYEIAEYLLKNGAKFNQSCAFWTYNNSRLFFRLIDTLDKLDQGYLETLIFNSVNDKNVTMLGFIVRKIQTKPIDRKLLKTMLHAMLYPNNFGCTKGQRDKFLEGIPEDLAGKLIRNA